jgi:hypothetical protein
LRSREEFFAKIQKLHDKVGRLEKELNARDEACSIVKLNNEATIAAPGDNKGRVGRRNAKLRLFESNYETPKEERDKLRSLDTPGDPKLESQV